MAKRPMRWYALSLDTLRGWLIFIGIALLVAAALFGYRLWERDALRRDAARAIAQARHVEDEVRIRGEAARFADELVTGRQLLAEARDSYEQQQYRRAADFGRRSSNVLAFILSHIESGAAAGEAHFIAVQGAVELRRGDSGVWLPARSRESLHSGDSVRTAGNGSAEIMFSDGTLYTLRPSTFLLVTASRAGRSGEQTVKMDYGWLNLSTARRPTRVATPNAEARVEEDTDAFVAFERESGRGRFGAFRGALDVSTPDGTSRHVGELEQVNREASGLSEALRLPVAPQPVSPPENAEIDPARTRELVLEWTPVPAATGYTLQVARSRLFVDNLIEDTDRHKVRATLGIRGEGSFQWRVGGDPRRQPRSVEQPAQFPGRLGGQRRRRRAGAALARDRFDQQVR